MLHRVPDAGDVAGHVGPEVLHRGREVHRFAPAPVHRGDADGVDDGLPQAHTAQHDAGVQPPAAKGRGLCLLHAGLHAVPAEREPAEGHLQAYGEAGSACGALPV